MGVVSLLSIVGYEFFKVERWSFMGLLPFPGWPSFFISVTSFISIDQGLLLIFSSYYILLNKQTLGFTRHF
jgi:hypothetical protein